MVTLLLWICPFTWPIAIARMIGKRRRAENDRLIAALGGTAAAPAKRRSPLGWLFAKAWSRVRPVQG